MCGINCRAGNVGWWETRLTTGGVPGQVLARKIELVKGLLELNCEALSESVSERLIKILKKTKSYNPLYLLQKLYILYYLLELLLTLQHYILRFLLAEHNSWVF